MTAIARIQNSLLFVLCLPLSQPAWGAQAPANFPARDNELVVQSVVEYRARGETIRLIAFRYSIESVGMVWVDGFGEAPQHASLRYFTRDTEIRIRNAPGGAVILSRPLAPTATQQAPSDVELGTGFTSVARQGVYRSSELFPIKLLEVTERYFPSGSERIETGGEIVQSRSTYRTMQVNERRRARVSVLVSFPLPGPNGQRYFRVQYVSQERLSHDTWTDVTSNDSRRVVEDFLDTFVSQLAGATR